MLELCISNKARKCLEKGLKGSKAAKPEKTFVCELKIRRKVVGRLSLSHTPFKRDGRAESNSIGAAIYLISLGKSYSGNCEDLRVW